MTALDDVLPTRPQTRRGKRAGRHPASRTRGPDPAVSLLMDAGEAERLAELLLMSRGTPMERRLLDQLWLRAVMTEQWRRTPHTDRPAFRRRADAVLRALDPPLALGVDIGAARPYDGTSSSMRRASME